eukprot:3006850-Heterocapsa_arctica.AAC.1
MAFEGHAMTIVGAWQVVIVDAWHNETGEDRGGVWRYQDNSMTLVHCVARQPLPFGVRRDPLLLADSFNV